MAAFKFRENQPCLAFVRRDDLIVSSAQKFGKSNPVIENIASAARSSFTKQRVFFAK
jgi:hypothetical protein